MAAPPAHRYRLFAVTRMDVDLLALHATGISLAIEMFMMLQSEGWEQLALRYHESVFRVKVLSSGVDNMTHSWGSAGHFEPQ